MRKYFAILLILALFTPSITNALQTQEKEYVHYIASTLIKLLQERISYLEGENTALKQKIKETPICVSAESETPQERYDSLMEREAIRIKQDFAGRINPIEQKMIELNNKIRNPEAAFPCDGYGCPGRRVGVEKAEKELRALEGEKRALEIERSKQLAAVGIFE